MPDVAVTIVGQNAPGAGPSEGAMPDFAALKAQAAAILDKSEAAPEPVVIPAADPIVADPTVVRVKGATTGQSQQVAEVVEPPVVPDPVDPVAASAAAALEIGDDQLVKVLVDGVEEIRPWKEAKGLLSGGAKFTKSMQQLAKEKQAFESERGQLTELQQREQAYQNLLRSPQALGEFMQRQFPQLFQQQPQAQAPAGGGNPDEIATLGEARAIAEQQTRALSQQVAELKQSLQQGLQETQTQIEHRQQTAKHATVIQSTLSEIFVANPVLNAIPNAEDLIRYNVALMQPKTEADAVTAFKTVAQGIVDDVKKHYTANNKVQAIAAQKQKLVTSSIEPAGGAAPQIAPKSFKAADGTVDWKAVTQAAKDFSNS